MGNEYTFFLHLATVFLLTLGALRLGKEALLCWACFQAVLANLFVLQQINLFVWQATCSDVFILGGVLSQNFLQEFWGAQEAKRSLRLAFLAMLVFALLSQIHLLYHPSATDWSRHAFVTILSCSPRLLFASLTSFLLVQVLDIALFAWLKKRFARTPLLGRMSISLICTQFLDTVMFSYLGLYGWVEQLGSVIFVSFCIKMFIAICAAPFTAFAKNLVRPSV